MKQIKIKLSPGVLRAIREQLGYSVEEIAKKLRISESELISIEDGISPITLSQMKKLSKIYYLPIAAFLSNNIPTIPKLCPLTGEGCIDTKCAWSIKTSSGMECAVTLLGTAVYLQLEK